MDICWFCGEIFQNGEWVGFSVEFDTYFHMECLNDALKDPDHQEATIIAKEIDSIYH